MSWDLSDGTRKYGRNPDVDAAEDLWSQGGDYSFLSKPEAMYVSSSEAADTGKLTVQGLDQNGDMKTEEISLNGQTQEALTGQWLRVFRAWHDDPILLAGDVYVAEQDTLTGGVPDTVSKIKAKVDAAFQQTLMAIYTVPRGFRGILLSFDAGLISSSVTTRAASGVLTTAVQGKSFLVKEYFGLLSVGTSRFKHDFRKPIILSPLTDVKMRVLTVSTGNLDIYGGFEIDLEKV